MSALALCRGTTSYRPPSRRAAEQDLDESWLVAFFEAYEPDTFPVSIGQLQVCLPS